MNPSFPITTHAVWTQRPTDIQPQLFAETQRLAAQGKTDDTMRITVGPEESPLGDGPVSHVYRDWLDTAAANEWITFNTALADDRLMSIAIDPTPPQ